MKRFALIIAAALALTGCALQAPPPVSEKVADYYSNPPTPRPVKVISALGDSYTGGSAMGGSKFANWTQALAGQLSTDSVEVAAANLGLGGSGYVRRGPTKKVFAEVVPDAFNDKTDVAVVFGSINDEREDIAEVTAAADKTLTATRKAVPKASLVVIAPAWKNANPPAEIYAIRDALKGLAVKHKAYFIDPLAERWFFDNPELIGSDGTHPTDEGHMYMGKKMAPHFKALIAE